MPPSRSPLWLFALIPVMLGLILAAGLLSQFLLALVFAGLTPFVAIYAVFAWAIRSERRRHR